MESKNRTLASVLSGMTMFFNQGAIAAEPPVVPPAPVATASAPAAAASAAVQKVDVVVAKCAATPESTKSAFLAGFTEHLVNRLTKNKVDGAGDVAGQLVQAAVNPEQPSCNRLPAQTVAVTAPANNK